VGVKLPDGTAHTAARGLPGASDWAPHGSPMSGWVLLPPDLLDDRDAVQQWVVRAYDLVRAAPADAPRRAAKPARTNPARAKTDARKPTARGTRARRSAPKQQD